MKLFPGGPQGAMLFWCPGCETHHGVWCDEPSHNGSKWDWDRDYDMPTVSPSILVEGTQPITDEEHAKIMAGEHVPPRPFRCHLYIRQGRLVYLSDCTHRLAGQVVDMVEEGEE